MHWLPADCSRLTPPENSQALPSAAHKQPPKALQQFVKAGLLLNNKTAGDDMAQFCKQRTTFSPKVIIKVASEPNPQVAPAIKV